MLQLRSTRIANSRHAAVLSSVTIAEEGIALVYAKEDGETKVRPSEGVAGEIFAGVSQSRNSVPAVLPYVEEGVIGATRTIKLPRTPLAGQLLVKVAGVQKTVVTTAPADATEVQIVGSDVVVYASEAGKAYFVQMLYTPSVIEAQSIVGDAPIGGLASTLLGSIGVLKSAEFGTNYFDASADWSDALYVTTGPDGVFTVGDVDNHIPNAIVKNAPNASNAFLVLSINIA